MLDTKTRPRSRAAWKQHLGSIGRRLIRDGSELTKRQIAQATEDHESARTQMRGWWNLLPFPSHRIALADGLWTTGYGVIAGSDVRTEIIKAACGGSLKGKTILDLGCCEGGFAVEFARLEADRSVGIEARPINFERCELVRQLLHLNNLEFVQADVKEELPKWENTADVVFMAGLLYHVADPFSLLDLAYRAARNFVFIDTHVADSKILSHNCSDLVTQSFNGRSYEGRFFAEYPPDVLPDMHASLIWAAWSDVSAFWPLHSELVRMAGDVGFSSVEPVDPAHYHGAWQVDRANRVMLLCRK